MLSFLCKNLDYKPQSICLVFSRLHKQIMEIGGTKLKSAETKVNQVTLQIDQVVGMQTKANVNIKTANR